VLLKEGRQFLVARLPAPFGHLDEPLEVGLAPRARGKENEQGGGLTRLVAEAVDSPSGTYSKSPGHASNQPLPSYNFTVPDSTKNDSLNVRW
jgi:hypothetical protein